MPNQPELGFTNGISQPSRGRRSWWILLAILAAGGVAVLAWRIYTTPSRFQTRVAAAREQFRPSYDAASLDELLALDRNHFDIAAAALLIERELDSTLDVRKELARLDSWVDSFVKRIPDGATDRDVVALLNSRLVEFAVSQSGAPRDGQLSRVLLAQTGNCLGLTTFYLAVGRRLGLEVQMCAAPMHVFVRYTDQDGVIDIETLNCGEPLFRGYLDRPAGACGNLAPRVKLSPQEEVAGLLANRAATWLQADEVGKALNDISAAITLDPLHPLTHILRGDANFTLGDMDSALSDYSRALALDPCHPKVNRKCATVYEEQRDYDHAIAEYTKAVEVDLGYTTLWNDHRQRMASPGSTGQFVYATTLYLDQLCALSVTLSDRARVWMRMGLAEKAIADFSKSIRILNDAKETLDAARPLAARWKESGQATNSLALSTVAYLETWQLSHDQARVFRDRADAWESADRFDDAIADYTEAIRLEPGTAVNLLSQAELLTKKGDYDGAIRDATEAIRLDSTTADAFAIRAAAHVKKDALDEADADIARALELDPEHKQASLTRAGVKIKRRDFDGAMEDVSRVIASMPNPFELLPHRAQMFCINGNYDLAWQDVLAAEKHGIKVPPELLQRLAKAMPRPKLADSPQPAEEVEVRQMSPLDPP